MKKNKNIKDNKITVDGNDNINLQDVHCDDLTIIKQDPQNNILPKELTARIPKLSPDIIVGRDSELTDLHQRLFNNKQVVLVNGLGGIGKTTLAQVYTTKFLDEYHHIAWIENLSHDITNSFISARGLLISLKIDSRGKEPGDLFYEIIMNLKGIKEKPCLLIIDNADPSLADVFDSLPGQPNWHILATSREQIRKFDLMELGFLSAPEAVELFLRYYSRGDIDREEIIELVKTVDLHTLTIEILAKTAQKQRSGIDSLKRAIEEDLKANVYVDHSEEKIERVTSYLCSIFSLSDLGENEIWVMKQFVCLPAEFHRYEDLVELIQPGESQKDDVFSEIVEELCDKGWLLRNKDNDRYKMHRVIGDVVKRKENIELSDVKPFVRSVTEKLDIDQAIDNPVDKFPWIPFGRSMSDIFPDNSDTDISTLQNNLALVLQDLDDYEGAKTLLEKAMLSDEQNFGPEHPTTALRYSNLANVLQDLDDYEGAKTLLEKAMLSDEQNFGTEHPNTAVSYSNLALVLQDLGDYEGAKTLLKKAMLSDEQNFGPEHPNTAVSYSNLALVLQDLGDYKAAKNLLEKAMRSDEQNFGTEHPNTAVSYSNLATVLQDLGDYEGAKNLLEKTMLSDEQNFGTEHPDTAVNYSNLASV
ncbi:MAG: ATP-binding protein, partial [bacterium]|nr:ATP-binding protein [bacterium]